MLQKLTIFFTISAICTLDLVNLMTKTVLAQTRSDTCIRGYVWRKATPNDRVCVTPEVRSQAAADNSTATSRIDPVDRTYGPFTCVQGYVWREATPNDLVCVTPEVRSQAAADNSQASRRRSVGVMRQPNRFPVPSTPYSRKTTVLPANPAPYQFLGINTTNLPTNSPNYSNSDFLHAGALSSALGKAREFVIRLSNEYGNENLELNYETIKRDEGFISKNKWVSWVIIKIIANPNYNPPVDCPQPDDPNLGRSCDPLPTACYFKDPRNCSRRRK
jgi:hypothetical protein